MGVISVACHSDPSHRHPGECRDPAIVPCGWSPKLAPAFAGATDKPGSLSGIYSAAPVAISSFRTV